MSIDLLVARAVIRGAATLLPDDDIDWCLAVEGELDQFQPGWQRVAFALSAAQGLVHITARLSARGQVADGAAMIVAALVGLVAASIDLVAPSRLPMMWIVSASAVTLGAWVPRAAWRWPLLIGGMLPAVAAISGLVGPYAFDRGDRWIPLAAGVLFTLVGVGLRRASRWPV